MSCASNPLGAAILTKHILQHVTLKAEEQAEATIFTEYGPEGKGIITDIQKEAMIAQNVAQGLSDLRQLSQQMSGENQPDPLIQLKEKELGMREQDNQRKAQESQQKMMLEQQSQQTDVALAQQKIASSESIAAEKADIARARLQQTERQAQNAPQNRKQ